MEKQRTGTVDWIGVGLAPHLEFTNLLTFAFGLLKWTLYVREWFGFSGYAEVRRICVVLQPGSIPQYLQLLVNIVVLQMEGTDLSFVWVGMQVIIFIVRWQVGQGIRKNRSSDLVSQTVQQRTVCSQLGFSSSVGCRSLVKWNNFWRSLRWFTVSHTWLKGQQKQLL